MKPAMDQVVMFRGGGVTNLGRLYSVSAPLLPNTGSPPSLSLSVSEDQRWRRRVFQVKGKGERRGRDAAGSELFRCNHYLLM